MIPDMSEFLIWQRWSCPRCTRILESNEYRDLLPKYIAEHERLHDLIEEEERHTTDPCISRETS